MSVSDVPAVLENHMELLVLAPIVSHGYLFHITGQSQFLVLAGMAVPYTAYFLSASYRLEAGEYVAKSGYHHKVMKYFTQLGSGAIVVSGAIVLVELVQNLHHGDLILIYLLLGNSIFALMLFVEWYTKNYFSFSGPAESD